MPITNECCQPQSHVSESSNHEYCISDPGIFASLAADGAYSSWRSLRGLTVLQTEDADDKDLEKQGKGGE
jgi:hypothetical protein